MKQIELLNTMRALSVTLLLRISFIGVGIFGLAGCINNQHVRADDDITSLSKPAEMDCAKYRQPYSLRDYTMQGIRVSQINAFIYGAKAQEGADTAIAKVDSIDKQIGKWKAKAGQCFGKGENGKQIADKYLWVKKKIAQKKAEIEEKLAEFNATNTALRAEEANFNHWRKNNNKFLIRDVGDMKLEIIWIAMRDIFGRPAMNTEFHIEATNTTNSKILMPRNSRIWGYENGSDVGGQRPIGVFLSDSFGNKYKLTSVTPSFLGSESKGIRPGQAITFKIRFGDVPLKNATTVRLGVDSLAFGQKEGTVFNIPIEAFYYRK